MIRILGIGSPYGDDQLGWQAIDLLAKHEKIQPYLNNQLYLEKCNSPGLNLLSLMHGAKTVFLIDGIKSDAPIGTIHRWRNLEIEQLNHPISSHQIGVGEVLRMGKILNEIPQNIILYGIEIAEVGLQFDMSLQINQSLNILVEQLIDELGSSLK